MDRMKDRREERTENGRNEKLKEGIERIRTQTIIKTNRGEKKDRK